MHPTVPSSFVFLFGWFVGWFVLFVWFACFLFCFVFCFFVCLFGWLVGWFSLFVFDFIVDTVYMLRSNTSICSLSTSVKTDYSTRQ